MKKVRMIGAGIALTAELAACSSGNSDVRPQPPKISCVHEIGSVLLNKTVMADILRGQNPVALRPIETVPADSILLEAPSDASQAELQYDDSVIYALHNRIPAHTTAGFRKETDTAVPAGDMRITTYRDVANANCASPATGGVA